MSLAVPTLAPELLLASGWAALLGHSWRGGGKQHMELQWEGEGGPVEGSEESWWWHSRQCPQKPLRGSAALAEQSLALSVVEHFEWKVTDFKQTKIMSPAGCGQVSFRPLTTSHHLWAEPSLGLHSDHVGAARLLWNPMLCSNSPTSAKGNLGTSLLPLSPLTFSWLSRGRLYLRTGYDRGGGKQINLK